MSEIEGRLPRARLILLCRNEDVLKWMNTCDHLMYQALVEILIPDVLRPIPSESSCPDDIKCPVSVLWCQSKSLYLRRTGALTQAIRNFAKSLEGWLTNAMSSIPQRMIQTKVRVFVLLHYCRLKRLMVNVEMSRAGFRC